MISDGITSSSTMNFLNQNSSLAAADAVMYSTFMVESIIIGCLELFQLTAPPLHRNTKFDVDFLLSMSDIKSESVYPYTRKSPPPKIKKRSLILLKYLTIFFTAIQCFSSGFDRYLLITLTTKAAHSILTDPI